MRISDWSSDVCSSDLYFNACRAPLSFADVIVCIQFTQKSYELELVEKIQKLQLAAQEKDLLQEQTEAQLREARAALLLLRCSNAKSASRLPYEVLYNTFKYLPAPELCMASCVNRYWHAVASVNALWHDEFLRRFGARKMLANLGDQP